MINPPTNKQSAVFLNCNNGSKQEAITEAIFPNRKMWLKKDCKV